MKKLGKYLLTDNRRAAVTALLCAVVPLIGGILAAVIVGLITLRKGYKAGLLVLHRFDYNLFDMLLLRCVLVWMFAVMLRRTHSWALTLELFVFLGALV